MGSEEYGAQGSCTGWEGGGDNTLASPCLTTPPPIPTPSPLCLGTCWAAGLCSRPAERWEFVLVVDWIFPGDGLNYLYLLSFN